MEKSTKENYRAEDGITDPKGESANIAGFIFNSFKPCMTLFKAVDRINNLTYK